MHHLFWALLILTAMAAIFRQNWIYFLIYVIGGIWALSHWWVRRSLRQLSVERTLGSRAFAGEVIPVVLRFENRSWLPVPWLQIREQVPLDLKDLSTYDLVMSVGSRARAEHRYTLTAKRRGYYLIGPLVLKTGDMFGFASGTWQESKGPTVTVYPQILPLNRLGLPSRSPFGNLRTHQRLYEDPTRLAGVRGYEVGDSLRRIHWKASAHEDNLLVKKFLPAIALNVGVVLDLNRNAYPDRGAIGFSEWAIVVAASILSYATEQRQTVSLISNGQDPFSEDVIGTTPARQGQGHLMEILALLARIQAHRLDEGLEDWLPRRINDLAWGTTLVVITPQVSNDLIWLLHNAYRRGSNVVVLSCAPQADLAVVKAQAEKLGILVHRTIWESELRALEEET